MKPQTRLLLLASVAAAALIVASCGVVVVAGGGSTHATMPVRGGSVEDLAERVEEAEEEAAYPQRRMLYRPQDIGYGGLTANKAACYGSCPAQGQAYTGRGCQPIYGCRGR